MVFSAEEKINDDEMRRHAALVALRAGNQVSKIRIELCTFVTLRTQFTGLTSGQTRAQSYKEV